MRTAAILLAAGSSKRFQGNKLQAAYRGKPLYRSALDAFVSSSCIDETVLVVNPGFPQLEHRERVRTIVNPDFEEGMGSSLRAGLRAASEDTEAFVIGLADMPEVSPALIASLMQFYRNSGKKIVVARYRGRSGHPVVISAGLKDRLLEIRGDVGARDIIRENPDLVGYFETDDEAVVLDVDTVDDLKMGKRDSARILIKGAGEMASAVAHRLFRCGYRVVMTDLACPTAVRRTVAFCSAILNGSEGSEGEIEIEGVKAVCHPIDQALSRASEFLSAFDWGHIPVFIDPTCELKSIWKPEVMIDARILKKNSDNHISDARLVIGLGPEIEAGKDAHYVVETHRGHNLGRIIAQGKAASDTGVPGDIGGFTRERVLLAPISGVFESRQKLGSQIQAGDVIGTVTGEKCEKVRARISGVLRGMVVSGLEVTVQQKIGDIDPRGDASVCTTFSDKARTISGSVLELVVSHFGR